MMNTQFSFARAADGTETIVLMGPLGVKIVPDTHVNYSRIKDLLQITISDGAIRTPISDGDLYALADATATVTETLRRLSDRVTFQGGTLYFDGDEMENRLTRHIVDMIRTDDDNWTGYVAFLENVQANPSRKSRKGLFAFLEKHGLTITPDGCFIAHKSVQSDGLSHNSGQEAVMVTLADGTVETHTGKIPNVVGSVIEMPRSLVAFDRDVACSVGLHVGSFNFASSFYGGGKLLLVKINPRDVVSVPKDANDQKIRVCRYEVVEENTGRANYTGTSYGVTLLDPNELELDGDYDEYDDDDELDEYYSPYQS